MTVAKIFSGGTKFRGGGGGGWGEGGGFQINIKPEAFDTTGASIGCPGNQGNAILFFSVDCRPCQTYATVQVKLHPLGGGI